MVMVGTCALNVNIDANMADAKPRSSLFFMPITFVSYRGYLVISKVKVNSRENQFLKTKRAFTKRNSPYIYLAAFTA